MKTQRQGAGHLDDGAARDRIFDAQVDDDVLQWTAIIDDCCVYSALALDLHHEFVVLFQRMIDAGRMTMRGGIILNSPHHARASVHLCNEVKYK